MRSPELTLGLPAVHQPQSTRLQPTARAAQRPRPSSLYAEADLGQWPAEAPTGLPAAPAVAPLATAAQLLATDQGRDLFERELLPHARALARFAQKLCGDRDQANDLVQETFYKACRYIGHFQVGSNAKAWLFRILKNAFINDYRRRQRQPQQVSLQDASPAARGQVAHLSSRRTEGYTPSLVSDEVLAAIRAMPADYRLVVLLCDVEEFTYDEIAQIVGIPVGTVRSRLHRGRNILRNRLANYAAARGYGEAPLDTDSEAPASAARLPLGATPTSKAA